MPKETALSYIRRIRNASKYLYAKNFYDWLTSGKVGDEPKTALSYMAAQAVRTRLHDLTGL